MTFYKLILYGIVALHYVLFFFLIASIPMLLIYEPWYVSVPVVVWLINLATLPVRCILTTWENRIRTKLGMPKINGFVSKHLLFRDK